MGPQCVVYGQQEWNIIWACGIVDFLTPNFIIIIFFYETMRHLVKHSAH